MNRVGQRLTAEAERDRADFESGHWGCACHIFPPCAHCTHPGNPANQDEDDECWELDSPEPTVHTGIYSEQENGDPPP